MAFIIQTRLLAGKEHAFDESLMRPICVYQLRGSSVYTQSSCTFYLDPYASPCTILCTWLCRDPSWLVVVGQLGGIAAGGATSRLAVCRAFEAGKVQAVMRRRVWGRWEHRCSGVAGSSQGLLGSYSMCVLRK